MQTSTYGFASSLAVAVMMTVAPAAYSQTLLNESFEGVTVDYETHYSALDIEGWETVDSQPNAEFPKRWCVYASGTSANPNNRAWIDAGPQSKTTRSSDYLLTPWLQLDAPCQLTFQWAASGMALDKKQFDLRIRIVEQGQQPGDQDFIFSILDPAMVLESGVQPTDYGWYTVPWVGWAKNISTIDLTPWQGKKVRVAFEYYLNGKESINSIEVDDVRVVQAEIPQQPVATPSITEWDFGKVYIGSKSVSEIFQLVNTGKGEMTVTGVEAPVGYSIISSVPMADIKLGRNESVKMQVMYDASMTSATSGNVVIKTNGQDGVIAVRATKQMLPDGYTFEGFEDTSVNFPPAGWRNVGDWRSGTSPIEGYLSAWASANMDNHSQDLITPRIDGSAGEITFEYNYYDYYDDEYGVGADNVVTVRFSKDGGNTWSLLDTYDWNGPYNENIHKSFTVQTGGSDNCLFKFAYEPLEEWDTEYGPEISRFFVDAVVLPPLYGANSAPGEALPTTPANGARDIYPRNITLAWETAQFAEGYRVYVGTDGAATNLVNGVDVQKATSYVIQQADYSKTYNWRVEAYNSKGSTPSATFNFTTQPDATVTSYPYNEGFEGEIFPPVGWVAEQDTYTKWYRSDYNPFDGNFSAAVQAGLAGSHAALTTPDFLLPADAAYLTFYWGDAGGVMLKVDDTGTRTNPTNGSNGIADLEFDIYVDGQWQNLALMSDPSSDDQRYWYRERIDLSPYAGKRVAFRWNRTIHNYVKATNASLDRISIEGAQGEKLALNFDSWDALKANYNCSINSGNIFTLLNDGSNEAIIDKVEFTGANFATSLRSGDKVASGKGVPFSLTFNAGVTAAPVEETMTITTRTGASVSMTLKGEAMPADTRFYGFEQDAYGSLQPAEFITVDVDGASNVELAMVDYENYGRPAAFMVMNYKKADWPNPYGNTGDQCLVTFATVTKNAEDWIIRPTIPATAESEFEFYARNYEHLDNSGWGQVFTPGTATVLVSTASDATDLTKYEEVATYTLEYPVKEEYTKYVTPLGDYDGQIINVALRHTVNTDGLAYLYDDFTFRHFDFLRGINSAVMPEGMNVKVLDNMIAVEGADDVRMSLLTTAGVTLATVAGNEADITSLAPGIYIVRIESMQGPATLRFVKK